MEKLKNENKSKRVILLPLDGSDAALKAILPARSFAVLLDAYIHILYVSAESLSRQELIKKLKIDPKELPEFVIDHKRGEPADEILDAVNSADYIIIYINKSSNTGEGAISPVAAKIMENCRIPVLLIRTDMTINKKDQIWRPEKILVPLDGTPEAAQIIDSSLEIIEEVAIDVLHIFTPLEKNQEGDALTAPYYEDSPRQEWSSWSKEFLKRFFPSVLERDKIKLSLSTSPDNPAQAIIDFSKENKNDLILLGWKGVLAPAHADTLKRIIQEVSCPVLLKKIIKKEETAGASPVLKAI